jgi:putative ABC transport system permease protein
MGWDDPLGKSLSKLYTFEEATVVGVVQDFHFQSLHNKVEPLALYPTSYLTNLYARVTANNIPDKLAMLGEKWQKIAPDLPFTYQFLDDTIEQQYQWENRWADIVQYASLLAIIVAGLGLFGLSRLNSAKRVKEIGIRKVLGASVGSLLALLSLDYVKLILIAILITIPIANYLITEWLSNFAYQIEISWWLFLVPAWVVLCIALLSVSSQTWKAARHNPVDSLRYE